MKKAIATKERAVRVAGSEGKVRAGASGRTAKIKYTHGGGFTDFQVWWMYPVWPWVYTAKMKE